ncbi:MAG: carboxypeptidase-like regulatory domain-containing protein [Bacteroidota bacterium]
MGLFAFLLMSASADATTGDSLFYFKGKVVDAEEMKGLSNVHVINKSLKTGTVSALDGSFRVASRVGDTLELTLVGYKKTTLEVEQSHQEAERFVMIPMRFEIQDMEVVTIYGKTFEQFRQDFKALQINPKEISEMTIKSIDDELDVLGPSSATGLGGPIQFLYDKFNKTESLRRTLQKNRQKTEFPPEAFEGFPTHPSQIQDTTNFKEGF